MTELTGSSSSFSYLNNNAHLVNSEYDSTERSFIAIRVTDIMGELGFLNIVVNKRAHHWGLLVIFFEMDDNDNILEDGGFHSRLVDLNYDKETFEIFPQYFVVHVNCAPRDLIEKLMREDHKYGYVDYYKAKRSPRTLFLAAKNNTLNGKEYDITSGNHCQSWVNITLARFLSNNSDSQGEDLAIQEFSKGTVKELGRVITMIADTMNRMQRSNKKNGCTIT